MKISQKVSTTDLSRQKEDSVILRRGHLRLPNLISRKKKEWGKWAEPKGSVGCDQIYQHTHMGASKERIKRSEKTIWRNNGWNVPKFD